MPPDGYDVETHAADAVATLDALDIDRVSLIGCPLGGKLALALAALFPRRVARLGLLDPPLMTSPAARASLRRFWERLDQTYPSVEAFLQGMRGSPLFGDWNPTVEAYLRGDVFTRADGTVPTACRAGCPKLNWRQRIATRRPATCRACAVRR